MTDLAPPHGLASPLDVHNRVLRAADARLDDLVERLAELLEPILERAGARAAAEFQRKATNHLTAAADGVTSTSTMIALAPRPEEAQAVALAGGAAPETLHVTLAYLGDVEGDLTAVADALRPVAASCAPLAGVVGGVGVFAPSPEGVAPAIALPDVPGLVELRVAVTDALVRAGIDYSRLHGFCAHLTLDYFDATADGPGFDGPLPLLEPLHFDSLLVVRGDVVEAELPLVGVPPLTAAASEDPFLEDLAAAMARPLEDPGRPTDRLSFGPIKITAAGEPPQWSSPAGDEIVDVDAVVQTLRTKTDPVRRALVEASMTPTLKAAGLDFDVTNPFTAKVLAQSGSHVTNIADTTRANVMRTVRASYDQGLSIPDTAKAIQAGMRDAAPARARTIARTEMAGAVNGGSLAATQIVSRATGDTYYKQWLTAPGAPFPRHEEYDDLNGQTRALDDAFDVGGAALDFPGDPGGEPGETINCRCALVYTDKAPEEDVGGGAPTATSDGGDVAASVVEGLAAGLLEGATALEPATTAAMAATAKAAGGRLGGLEFRLKTKPSLERKIRDDLAEARRFAPDATVEQVAGAINDSLRYTIELAPAKYGDGVRAAVARLQDAGYELVKMKNYWGNEDYQGINAVFRAPGGGNFELQFHTPTTFELKTKLHAQYEGYRTSHDPVERRLLWDQMAAEQKRVATPDGALGIGTAVRHTFAPSP